MKNIIFDNRLEDLLKSTDYSDLTIEESEFADSFLTKEEYGSFRKILLETKRIKTKDVIWEHKEDKNRLLNIFESRYKVKNSSFFKEILDFSVPVYKIAAGMILVLGAVYLINMKFFPSSHERIVYITDTIYKEVHVPQNMLLADSSIKEVNSDSQENTAIIQHSNSHHTNTSSTNIYDKGSSNYNLEMTARRAWLAYRQKYYRIQE